METLAFGAGIVVATAFWKLLRNCASEDEPRLPRRRLELELSPTSRILSWGRDKPLDVHRTTFYATQLSEVIKERIVIAMVGLPARGKSYISKAIMRYLGFLGVSCKLFNAGNKRRDQGKSGADAEFFNPSNHSAQTLKEQMAMETLEELFDWLTLQTEAPKKRRGGLACAIFDATNTTSSRRRAVVERCARESPPVTLVFLESVCDDETILHQNYEMKLVNDDYKGADAQKALDDFLERVRQYERVYEQICDVEVAAIAANGVAAAPLRYVKVIDAGKQITVSNLEVDSLVCKWIVQLMFSIHLAPRKVSIVIAGESLNDRDQIRGGDTQLSEDGLDYAREAVEVLIERAAPDRPPPCVMIGTLRRYVQMGDMLRDFSTYVLPLVALNELCFGSLEELRVGRLRDSFPAEHAAREADKLNYRYPGVGGQSYSDLAAQMREVLLSIESSRLDTVVVCDVAVARVLLGYFEARPIAQIPNIDVSPGIIELTRTHSGFTRTDVRVDVGHISMLGVWECGMRMASDNGPLGALHMSVTTEPP